MAQRVRQYVLCKYVNARTALEALRKDNKTPVADVIMVDAPDDPNAPAGPEFVTNAVGYKYVPVEDDEDCDDAKKC